MQFFRDVSLKVKLLGIYFFGLILLGVVGYGLFIYTEVQNYYTDKSVFSSQGRYFQEKSFRHMKYTMDLHGILTRLYSAAGDPANNKENIVKEFISNVLILSDDSYSFAIFDFSGNLVAANGSDFKNLINSGTTNRSKLNLLIKKAFEARMHGAFADFSSDGKNVSYFINTMYFEPLDYYILSLDKTQRSEENIDSILLEKRMRIIKSVVICFILGLAATTVVVGILYTYLKGMTKNINRITRSIGDLGSAGVIETKLEAVNRDEIGRMIAAFNDYLQKRLNMEQFKQLIEEDKNIHDVYVRVFGLLNSFGFHDFAIYEVDEAKNKINYLNHEICGDVCTLEPMPCSDDILISPEECRCKRLAQTVFGSADFRACPKFLGYDKNRKHMCMPIIIAGSVGEVVHVTVKPEDEEMLKKALPLLQDYLKNASPVIESKKLLKNLRETTLKDPLTGLNNRRFLEEYTEILTADTKRRQKNMGILMCDLDYFKKVNDDLGHETGDRVLQILATIMKGSVRSSDIIIRYGGEEFLIIIKDAEDDESVMRVAEKIRENMEAHEMRLSPNVTLKKTLSIGVSIFPKDTENFWQAIKFADISLYKAKEAGRNKVMRFTRDMWTHDTEY
ncbi:sensor domain-containing diguanylate cyclase [Geovibrio thiophilus]|uniref:Sensor domain-containing diguanylate cyclase n=1 Tax=Geovibrio thiophilus TaxID=139438 RepID=A0A410K107_9BACT|nr:sensor domain-containing diguanylate cyclase [Geovibrio thiophilus]QAR34146.1 sensor domain-containing diguanylate cyclase [Geovibrio thiophilus]